MYHTIDSAGSFHNLMTIYREIGVSGTWPKI